MKITRFLAAAMAVTATVALLAQEQAATEAAPETAPEAVTEDTGSWMPKISVDMGVTKGYFDRGILWDTNTGYEVSLNFDDVLIENLGLSIYGRLPIDRSNYSNYATYPQLDDEKFAKLSNKTVKYYGDKIREDDYDNFGMRVNYSLALPEVPLLGNVSLLFGYRLQKNADIYSKYKYKRTTYEHYAEGRITDYWAYDRDSGEIAPLGSKPATAYETIDLKRRSTYRRRDEVEQDFSLGISFDDVMPYVVPNASITFNQDAHYYAQMGLRSSLPCTIISEKLTWNNNLDIYYFGDDYVEYKQRNRYNEPFYKGYLPPTDLVGIFENNELVEVVPLGDVVGNLDAQKPHSEAMNGKTDWTPHRISLSSYEGFKNLIWSTSLDYAFNERVKLTGYARFVKRLHGMTHNDDYAFPNIHKFEAQYGVKLSYMF